jgi:hypothetical protein
MEPSTAGPPDGLAGAQRPAGSQLVLPGPGARCAASAIRSSEPARMGAGGRVGWRHSGQAPWVRGSWSLAWMGWTAVGRGVPLRPGPQPAPLSRRRTRAIMAPLRKGRHAGVTQLVECLLPKQNVDGSSPFTRSNRSLTAAVAVSSGHRKVEANEFRNQEASHGHEQAQAAQATQEGTIPATAALGASARGRAERTPRSPRPPRTGN